MTFYLGPYMEAEFQSVPGTESRRGCGDAKCSMYGAHPAWYGRIEGKPKFCATCGAPIGDVEFPIIHEVPDREDVREAINERLTSHDRDGGETTHLWQSNMMGSPGLWDDAIPQDLAITPKLIKDEIKQFEAFYVTEIALLCKLYKPNRPTIRWGLINVGD